MLDDDTRRRVLRCLLVSQRHSWDQGLTAAVLDGDGEDAALRVLVDDAGSPPDTAVAAMLAFSALTGAGGGWLPRRYAATGRSLLAATVASLDPPGRVTGAAAAPRCDSPGHSPEAQALLLLADAAARRLGGPHTSAATSAAQPHDRVTPAPPWP